MGSQIHDLQGLSVDDFLKSMDTNFVPSPRPVLLSDDSSSSSHSPISTPSSFPEQDSSDDSVIFSDFVFSYIDRMLMEEQRFDGLYHPADMLATEQQFSAILGGGPTDEPPLSQLVPAQPADLPPLQTAIDWPSDLAYNMADDNFPYDITSNDHSLFYGDVSNHINFGGGLDDWHWQNEPVDSNQLNGQLLFANTNTNTNTNTSSFSSFSSLSPAATTTATAITTTTTTTTTSSSDSSGSENYNNISSANVTSTATTDFNTVTSTTSNETVQVGLEESMFRKGLEEAQKFLPKAEKLIINVESTDFNVMRSESAPQSQNQSSLAVQVKEKDNNSNRNSNSNSNSNNTTSPESQQRGRKNPYRDRDEAEKEDGRNNKQVAYTEEETIREMFDKVLLGGHDKCVMDIMALPNAKHNEQVRITAVAQASTSINTKGRGRRKAAREVVDLRTILIHCAQVYNFTTVY
jgi:hypothetical protein